MENYVEKNRSLVERKDGRKERCGKKLERKEKMSVGDKGSRESKNDAKQTGKGTI